MNRKKFKKAERARNFKEKVFEFYWDSISEAVGKRLLEKEFYKNILKDVETFQDREIRNSTFKMISDGDEREISLKFEEFEFVTTIDIREQEADVDFTLRDIEGNVIYNDYKRVVTADVSELMSLVLPHEVAESEHLKSIVDRIEYDMSREFQYIVWEAERAYHEGE